MQHPGLTQERVVGLLPDGDDAAGDLVPQGQRQVVGQHAFVAGHHEEIRVAQADGLDLEQDLAPLRLRHRHLDALDAPAPTGQLVGGHHTRVRVPPLGLLVDYGHDGT